MSFSVNRLGASFSAGAFGGLAHALAAWLAGATGVSAALGLSLAPGLTAEFLYPRIVWGGIFGFLFMFRWPAGPLPWRAVVYSLGPTLVQLLILFPFREGKGWFGLALGPAMPMMVIALNLIWALAAALFLSAGRGGR